MSSWRSCWLLGPAGALALVTATGCGDEPPAERPPPPPANLPPAAAILVSPLVGIAPLEVTGDASASSDPDDPLAALRVRWDFDGDGAWDTAAAPLGDRAEHTYATAGSYLVRAEVSDGRGKSTVATAAAPVVVYPPGTVLADLDADANRDGVITDLDDAVEGSFGPSAGAVLLVNWDDDDGDLVRDGNDAAPNGAADRLDLNHLIVRRMETVTPGHRVTLSASPAGAAANLRLFVGDSDVAALEPGGGTAELDPVALAAADLDLWLEVVSGRSAAWDGAVLLELGVYEGATLKSSDSVAARAAPLLFTDNARPAEAVYVMRIARSSNGPNLPFYDALVAHLPAGLPLGVADEDLYDADRWAQDNMQTAYQVVPGLGAPRVVPTYLQVYRHRGSFSTPEGLEDYLTGELVGAELGYAYPCIGGSCNASSLNYGGNIEVAPPHQTGTADYPLGRLIIGGGELGTVYGNTTYHDHMAAQQHDWLDGQGPQGPTLEISSEWLAVGHVDEFFLFVPDLTADNGRPWKVVIASPTLARAGLRAVIQRGDGDAPVFAGRDTETTAAALFDDDDLTSFNALVQARIDSQRAVLAEALGLDDTDFVELPVLYEEYYEWGSGGTEMAVALNPGLTNLVVIDDLLLVPDPEGPRLDGADVWKTAATQALAPLGVEVVFVDVFESYHLLMGEAHCGTNVATAAHDTPWWQL